MVESSPQAVAGAVDLDTRLRGVLGGRTATALEKAFGLTTVADLLAHYPRRYAHRGELTSLTGLPVGENATIVAEVRSARERPMRARRGSLLEVTISDGSGVLTLTFFNQSWRGKELVPGARGIFAGKVSAYRGALQLAHPDYELFEAGSGRDDPEAARTWATTPIPLYPATSSIASWQIQRSIGLVLDALGEVDDPVPEAVRHARGLIPYRRALELVHRPSDDADVRSARSALRYAEAFVLQVALAQQRAELQTHRTTPRTASAGGLLERFDATLDFRLTDDQREVGERIRADLASETPMNRLVQGEVGSGKTLVALRGMLTVAESGGQCALLAPTEVLAAQHLRSITDIVGPDLSAELLPTLLTGQLGAGERKRALLRIASGQSRIVVGTHALLGENVGFADLGLVVVDEQHRFGVEQREALRRKGQTPPHVLVLTATPIPRTVAMTVFGDLDISSIAELPTGRRPIETFVVPLADRPGWEGRIWERAAEEVAAGHQVFVVCPAISPQLDEDGGGTVADGRTLAGSAPGDGARPAATVTEVHAAIRDDPALAAVRTEVLHGRLSSDEKESTMRAFAAGDLDLLVATTVIEVGVDVPNASTMIVLDADRFGISQLHQLRGRVGRGPVAGLCLLVTAAESGTPARERVEAVAATTDGFELAEVDLQLRREGDVLGAEQSGGRSSLKLLRVARDAEVIGAAREAAHEVVAADPGLRGHPALAAALARRLDEAERAFLAKS